ncbi:MAG: alpha/beta fold hydrolase [Pseudonocardia sp.]
MTTTTPTLTSETVDVGDTTLHVSRSGTGAPLVWLHGSGPGASGLSNFRGNLAAFDDFANLVFDFPRFGRSGRPHIEEPLIPYSGTRILRALDAVGVERFSVVGNSYGGGVASWIAGTAPDRVDSMVLMAPAGMYPPAVTGNDDLPYGIQLIYKAMREGITRELMREFVSTMVFDQSLVTDELIDQRYEVAVRSNPEMEGVVDLGRVDALLPAITARSLVTWGADDRFLLPEWSLTWHRAIAGSEVHVFARCGHWAQHERRDAFNQLVGNFLRSAAA